MAIRNLCRGRLTAVIMLALATFAVGAASSARASSIWDRRDRRAGFLCQDVLAAEVGDLLTVLISDESSFTKKGERELDKSTSSSGSAKYRTPIADFTITSGTLSQTSSRSFEGSSEHNSSRTFEDSITVTVMDKLPNGNLVVAGRSERCISEEKVTTILTGIVKPEDISANNTISSTRVAHLKLFYDATGEDDAYMRPGWLNRVIDLVWPF